MKEEETKTFEEVVQGVVDPLKGTVEEMERYELRLLGEIKTK